MLKSLIFTAAAMSLAALVQPAAIARDADAVTEIARIIEAEFYDEARAHAIADDLRSDAAGGAFDAYPSPDALASATPRSVMSPLTRRAGVTSKAGLRAPVASGDICTSVTLPSASLPWTRVTSAPLLLKISTRSEWMAAQSPSSR